MIAVALLIQGLRNILWTAAREQERFRAIVSRGLASHMATNGIMVVVFGGLLAYSSRSVPLSLSWQVLGLAIVILGCITVLLARLGSMETPALEQMPAGSILRKRVRGRRFSGALFMLGGIAWVWNGLSLVVQ